MKNKKQPTRATLEARLRVAHASSPCALAFAKMALEKLKKRDFVGSAVVVTITNLDGTEVIDPVYCADGLKVETIDQLIKQVEQSEALQWVYTSKGRLFPENQ